MCVHGPAAPADHITSRHESLLPTRTELPAVKSRAATVEYDFGKSVGNQQVFSGLERLEACADGLAIHGPVAGHEAAQPRIGGDAPIAHVGRDHGGLHGPIFYKTGRAR